MSKYFFIIFLASFLMADNVLAQVDEIFEKYIVSSQKAKNPLLEKVFPGSEFLIQTSECTMPRRRRIVGKFNNQIFLMPQQFNLLFKKIESNSKATVEERIEAFVRFWRLPRRDDREHTVDLNSAKEITIIPVSEFLEDIIYNYKVTFVSEDENYEMLIIFDNDQIKRVVVFQNGQKITMITPTLLSPEDYTYKKVYPPVSTNSPQP